VATSPNLIQQIPRGLLAALEAKGTGRNPQVLADFVQCAFELEPYFLATRLEAEGTVVTGATTGANSAIVTVPTGEYWRLVNLSLQLSSFTDVAAVASGFVGILPVNGTTTCVLAEYNNPAWTPLGVLGRQLRVSWSSPYPLVLPPGTQLTGALQYAIGAGTVSVTTRALFYRLTGG
jgi:hypothetical protein